MSDKNMPPDRLHRLLFSHPQLIEDLLRHFVTEDPEARAWVDRLDFSSLRREHESSTEPKRGKSLYRDAVWSIEWRDGSERNTVAGLMALEQSRTPEELLTASTALDTWLSDPGDEDLREAFAVLIHQQLPENLDFGHNPLDLKETAMGVRENLQRWRDDYAQEVGREERAEGQREGRAEGQREGRAEGQREGRAEGQREGRAEGQRALLEKLMRLKFGSLPADAIARLARADGRELEGWAGKVLTAGTIDEIWRSEPL